MIMISANYLSLMIMISANYFSLMIMISANESQARNSNRRIARGTTARAARRTTTCVPCARRWDRAEIAPRSRRDRPEIAPEIAPRSAGDRAGDRPEIARSVPAHRAAPLRAQAGSLICCDGPCRRAFHLRCIPHNNRRVLPLCRRCIPVSNHSNHDRPRSSDGVGRRRWRCADCVSRRFRCFACKVTSDMPCTVHPDHLSLVGLCLAFLLLDNTPPPRMQGVGRRSVRSDVLPGQDVW